MEWLTQFPWGTLAISVVFNGAAMIAILGFGAPLWVLLPAMIAAATLDAELNNRVRQRSGRS